MKPTRCHPDDEKEITRLMEYIPLAKQSDIADEYSFLYQSGTFNCYRRAVERRSI